MSVGVFLNREQMPSAEEIRAALGRAWGVWEDLNRHLCQQYTFQPETKFGGKNYGWMVWYRRSGKTLVALYPQQGGFVAQVVLGKEQVEKALELDLTPRMHRAIEETPQLHDGRWLFLRVESEVEAADLRRLLEVKARPRRTA